MPTLVEPEAATGVIKFATSTAVIADLAAKYLPLKVAGLNDKHGLTVVHAARMEIKTLRVDVARRRVELKAGALQFGRDVDAEARRLTALLEPIETHLEKQEQIVADEKERIRLADLAAKRLITDTRLKALTEIGVMANPMTIADMPDDAFARYVAEERQQYEVRESNRAAQEAEAKRVAQVERDRLAAEQVERARLAKIESDKLAAERAELERQRVEQEAAEQERRMIEDARLETERIKLEHQRKEQVESQRRIDAENKRLADAEAERVRAVELERLRVETAERTRIETEQRIASEKAAAEAKAAADKLAAERLEAVRPDREKLLTFADTVSQLEIPEFLTTVAIENDVQRILDNAAVLIRRVADKLGSDQATLPGLQS